MPFDNFNSWCLHRQTVFSNFRASLHVADAAYWISIVHDCCRLNEAASSVSWSQSLKSAVARGMTAATYAFECYLLHRSPRWNYSQ
jgi:hypothetical protein